ncbi:hypothetical protein BE17_48090 [Sorangium cellulosum]|uniref:Uncharacterized protein n=1 Tax=Sorangium cellulosum TaxID=56 RepID=A0A150RQM3_SORCE|nr:hypothetical protein BE17_48090 [Sorangium cellulosum]
MARPTPKKSAPARPSAPNEAAEAFALIEPELERIEKAVPINVDIPRAVAVAVGAVPHLKALRARFVDELPRFPIDALDRLMSYALGAWYAHLLALPAGAGQDGLKPLLDEASALRADLLVAAEALAHKGFVDAGRVAEIRSGKGHLDTANDLVALAALFGESWDAVKNRTTVEWPDVERASKLGPDLLVALGARNQPGLPAPKAADPADRRARAFTLLVRAYDQCRRGVTYLRWAEGDHDAIAPSLFATRGGARRAAPAKDETTDEEAGETTGESGMGLGDGEAPDE